MRNGRALLAAMGRASSLVSSLAAERRFRLILEIKRRPALRRLASRTMKYSATPHSMAMGRTPLGTSVLYL